MIDIFALQTQTKTHYVLPNSQESEYFIYPFAFLLYCSVLKKLNQNQPRLYSTSERATPTQTCFAFGSAVLFEVLQLCLLLCSSFVRLYFTIPSEALRLTDRLSRSSNQQEFITNATPSAFFRTSSHRRPCCRPRHAYDEHRVRSQQGCRHSAWKRHRPGVSLPFSVWSSLSLTVAVLCISCCRP